MTKKLSYTDDNYSPCYLKIFTVSIKLLFCFHVSGFFFKKNII